MSLPNITRYLIGFAITAFALFLIWFFSNIVTYILISAVLAIMGKPLVDAVIKLKIKNFHIPRWIAAVIAVIAIWTSLILFFTFFIPLVLSKVSELANIDVSHFIESFKGPLVSVQTFLSEFMGISEEEFSIVDQLGKQLHGLIDIGKINVMLSSTLHIISRLAVALFSITFITFFFLKEENLFQNMVISLFPKKYEQNVINAITSITRLLIRYFTGILAESLIITILLSSVLMICGFTLETALFMGFVMGVLNVIPYIGPLIGTAICFIVGIVSPMNGISETSMILIIGLSIAVIKGLDDFILQPTLYSNRVKAHPLEIFIVILVAGSLAGVLGMLLAIPSYNVIRVVAKEFFNNFRLVQKLTVNI